MRDETGREQKLLAVPTVDPRFAEVADLPHLPRHFLAEIEHFFQVYKALEAKDREIYGWAGAGAAARILAEAQGRARRCPR